jgi:hypothetical protein
VAVAVAVGVAVGVIVGVIVGLGVGVGHTPTLKICMVLTGTPIPVLS